jgi:hypothetical protein
MPTDGRLNAFARAKKRQQLGYRANGIRKMGLPVKAPPLNHLAGTKFRTWVSRWLLSVPGAESDAYWMELLTVSWMGRG